MDWLTIMLISAFLLALATIIQKNVLRKEHTFEFVIIIYIAGTIFLSPFLIQTDFSMFNSELTMLIILRALFASSGFLFISKALRHADISIVEPNNQTYNITFFNESAVDIKWYINNTEKVLNQNSSELIWDGNYSQAGDYEIKVNITNNAGTDEEVWVLTVNNTPRYPSIQFIVPTPANNTNTTNSSFIVNVSIEAATMPWPIMGRVILLKVVNGGAPNV